MNTSPVPTIRGYELRERIGAGGFGEIFRAYQPAVEREVAIKVILPQFANHPDFIRRFESEAQLVARLEHPYIVPLYDYWREPDGAYLVMRWLRGGSLHQSLEQGPWTPEATARLLDQIASALAVAHRQGVVHRDVKPENILLDEEGNGYLTDFGIAKELMRSEGLTEADAIVGSPAYISPEQARSEPLTPQSDLYSLGVVMYQVLTAEHPFSGVTPAEQLIKHLTEPLPPLRERRSDLSEGLEEAIQKATAKNPTERYPDALAFAAAFREAISGVMVKAVAPPPEWVVLEMVNPYKGLRAFGEADAADFFGRETLTEQLLARLGEDEEAARFLAVVGPSGSGKSSVVKAGLIPALRQGALPGSEDWLIVEMFPGAHPLEELEAALLRVAVNPPPSLIEQLKDERGLLRAVKRTLPSGGFDLLLVIDQFEELFTLVDDEAVQRHLMDSLLAAVADPRSRLRVVVTLRADFYDRPLRYAEFGELLCANMETVMPLSSAELERAICGPAERAGANLEVGLVAAIVAEVNEQPGALPILQYALTELFERHEGRLLTREAYQAIGGVSGALARRAEEVYAGLDDAAQKAAHQLFLRLVTLGEGVVDTRRRVLRGELMAVDVDQQAMDAVIESFGRLRLLLFDRDPATRAPTVEVAHEALLREWARLRGWLDESRADVRLQRILGNATAEWLEAERDPSFLLRGTRLAQFEGWAAGSAVALTEDEHGYLEASRAERERRQAEREQRRRRVILGLAGGLVVAVALALVALFFARQSEQDRRVADQERQVAEEQRLVAEEQRQTAEEQRQAAEEQEMLARVRALAGAATSNLQVDPNLSLLLALQAVDTTYRVDGSWEPEAVDALHRALGPTGRLQHTFDGAGESWGWIWYSPDGGRVGASFESDSGESASKVWDVATGEELLSVTGEDVAFNPDGSRLATLVWENWEDNEVQVRVWDANTGEGLQIYPVRLRTLEDMWGIWLMADWEHMVAYYGDGTVEVYDVASGSLIPHATRHTSPVIFFVYTDDSRYFATYSLDGAIRIWALPSGGDDGPENQGPLVTLSDRAGPFTWYNFSPDGQYLMTVCDDFTAELWDVTALFKSESVEEALLTSYELDEHPSEIKWITFSPDNRLLATASDDGLVTVRRTFSGQVVLTLVLTDDLRGIAFNPQATHLAVVGMTGKVRVLDITPTGDAEWLALNAHDDWVYKVVYSPDGAKVASASWDGTAKLWDARTGELVHTLDGHTDRVNSVAFSPDGRRLATASGDATAKIWGVATGEELLTLSGHDRYEDTLLYGVVDVVYSPDGERLATAGWDETIMLWDAETGRHLRTLDGSALSVVFSPDGSLFAGANEWPINVWDAASLDSEPVWQFTADDLGFIMDVAFSPDNALLAGAHPDGAVSLWDVTDPDESDRERQLTTLTGSRGVVRSVVFSPDGQQLAASSADVTRVFDVDTGQQLYSLPGHSKTVFDVAFSPDGTRLASGSLDGTVRVYVLPVDELIALARGRLTRGLTESECQQYFIEPCPVEGAE